VELLGRLVMVFLLMAVASLAGLICGLVVYLFLRRANRPSRRASLVAGFFPPAVMGYLLACLVLSSAISGVLGTPDFVFGDIKEALPNGFTIEALDKMPECGHIQKAGDNSTEIAWVGKLQVEGPFVFGKYDYTYFPRTPEQTGRDFFLFDTRTHKITNFASESELANSAKSKIHLIPTAYFKGLRLSRQRVSNNFLLLLAVGPPFVTACFLLWRLLVCLRSDR
jgi:hypothetical protein